MTTSRPHNFSDLRAKHLVLLARLLSLPPNQHPLSPSWTRSQSTHITTLPSNLLSPSALLLRLAMRLPSPSLLHRALLCPTHKPLNPFLIRQIFLSVTAEVTTRLERLTCSPTPPLPANIDSFVRRLQSMNSLWMSPDLYRVTFQVSPYEARPERVESHCEACILARIGGTTQMLCDLRTTLLGRRKKRAPAPRLLGLVEAWIECSGRKEEILSLSDGMGREVRAVRRKMQLARRRRQAKKSEGLRGGGKGKKNRAVHVGDHHVGHVPARKRSWESGCTTLNNLPSQGPRWGNENVTRLPELPDETRTSHRAMWGANRGVVDDDAELENHITLPRAKHGEREDAHEVYFEDAVIDYYARLSSISGPAQFEAAKRNSIHPVFEGVLRNSLVFDGPRGDAFEHHSPQQVRSHGEVQLQSHPYIHMGDHRDRNFIPQPPPRRPTYNVAWSESNYSRDDVDNLASRRSSVCLPGTTRWNADEYRALVEIEEEDEDSTFGHVRGRTTARDGQLTDRSRRWD